MVLSVPDHIKITELDGKCVLLDCKRNYFYAVSKSGAQFFNQIKIHGIMEKAIKSISNSYNISENRVEEDMILFVNSLIEKGLIIKQ
jgi:hypothetical protein